MEIDKIMAELDSVGYYPTKNIAYTVNAAVSCNKPLLIEAVFMLALSLYKKIAQNHNSGLKKGRVVVF